MASEAAMLLSAAEAAMNDEDGNEALRLSNDALAGFQAAGDSSGIAESLRILANAHVLQEQEEEGLRIAEEQLKVFRDSGDKKCEAILMLACAEIGAGDKFDGEKRDEALNLASEARTTFRDMGEAKLQGHALLAMCCVFTMKAMKSYRMNEAEGVLPLGSEALEIFHGLGDKYGQAKTLHRIATASACLQDYSEAVSRGQGALEIWRDLNYRRMEGLEQNCIAGWHMSNRNPQDALDAAEAAMTVFAELDDSRGWEGVCLGTMTSAYLALGEKGAALRGANDRLARFQRRKDKKGECAAWDAIVMANMAKDDLAEALRQADKGLTFMRDTKDRNAEDKRWEAGMLSTIASIHLADEQYGKSNKAAQAAVAIYKECGFMEDMASVLVLQSNSSLAMKENRDALKQATDARNICRNAGNRTGEAIASIALCGAHFARADMLKAANAATDAIQLFNAERKKKEEAHATYVLTQVYMGGEDWNKAFATAKKAAILFKEAGFPKDETNMALMSAQITFYAGLEDGSPVAGQAPKPAWEKALVSAKDALVLARKAKDDDLISKAITFVAQVHVMTYQTDEAKTLIDEGISVCIRSGNESGEGYHNTLLTEMYFMNDKAESAKAPANKALAIFKKLGDAEGESLITELLKFIDPGEEEYAGPTEEMLSATVMDVALSLIGTESLAGDTPLMDAGLDSLASVEFQNTLAKEFTGVTLPSTLVFDFPTPKMITEHIYNGLREAAKRKALAGH